MGGSSRDHHFVLCHGSDHILLAMTILYLYLSLDLVHDHGTILVEMAGEEAWVVHNVGTYEQQISGRNES